MMRLICLAVCVAAATATYYGGNGGASVLPSIGFSQGIGNFGAVGLAAPQYGAQYGAQYGVAMAAPQIAVAAPQIAVAQSAPVFSSFGMASKGAAIAAPVLASKGAAVAAPLAAQTFMSKGAGIAAPLVRSASIVRQPVMAAQTFTLARPVVSQVVQSAPILSAASYAPYATGFAGQSFAAPMFSTGLSGFTKGVY